MIDLFQSSLFAVACVAVPLSLLLWLLALDRKFRGMPLIVWSPRQPVPWTVFDLLLLLLIGLMIAAATQLLLAWYADLPLERLRLSEPDLTSGQRVHLLVAFSVASALTWIVSLLWLRTFAGASWTNLGWPAGHRRQDLTLGLVAFIMLVVPMLCIHFLAQWVFPTEETHPFIEMVLQNPQPVYLAPIVVAAVIVAPIVEEFMFRVFLQGWLERLCLRGPRPQEILQADAQSGPTIGLPPTAVGDSPEQDTPICDSRPDRSLGPETLTDFGQEVAISGPARWLPIPISGLLFALAHAGQGPAPIPLLFLGLGLGYLYQRTHRVLPCIVVHILVNTTAVVQLALYVALQGSAD